MTQPTLAPDRSEVSPARPRARTRAGLYGALLSLLEEKTFEQVTVRDITTRAQVGYATFFRHYPDKEALLHDLAEQQISQLLAMTLPILYTVDRHASVKALCAFVWEHRQLWKALLTGGAAGILKGEFVRQAQQLAARQSSPASRIPTDLRVLVPVSSTIEVLAWWLAQREPLPAARIAEFLDELVVAPVMPGGMKTGD